MRKATMCLLLLLFCAAAFGQNQPQWKVVQSVILTHQSAAIPQTTIFTPEKAGVYRMTAFMSVTAKQRQSNTSWSFGFACGQGVGQSCSSYMSVQDGQQAAAIPSYAFSPEVGISVTYNVQASDPPPVDTEYNLVVTIEQLQ
jgi:hypothetical protein